MIRFRLRDIVEGTRGALVSNAEGAECFTGVSIDSRTTRPGQVFFALRGKVHDGHDFIRESWKKGAVMAVIDTGIFPPPGKLAPIPTVLVEDTSQALFDFAAYWRGKHTVSAVAVVGSVGKTTTREMLFSIFSTAGPCLRNPENFNNDIGLPLTLLQLEDHHRYAVLEIGANSPGEIRNLGALVRPTGAVITRIGWAHLEGFGTPEALAAEKISILEELPADGWCAVNGGDPFQAEVCARARCSLVTYGFGGEDVSADEVSFSGSQTEFTLRTPEGKERVRLKAAGRHFVENAVAAVAGALPLGISMELVISGLSKWTPVEHRGGIISPMPGVHFIDDTYNANPLSVQTALTGLAQLSQEGITVAVLGGMEELGNYHREGHLRIGEIAANLGIDYLLPVGGPADLVAQGALRGGMDPSRVKVCNTAEEAIHILDDLLTPGMWVLFKGSRASRMEDIMKIFLQREPSTNTGGF